MNTNTVLSQGTSTVPLYVSMDNQRKKRAPYKKDKFAMEFVSDDKVLAKTTTGKVVTLNQIGEMLDQLIPGQDFTVRIRKE